MEGDLIQHHRVDSASFPVEGMESVLVTVSGYHGSARFNLIKLLSRAGAKYIGNMNQSVTHLVCWKYEGRKYELARKFKIVIVNHSWIEECIKRGTRVPEEPYTLKSGEEMGPLVMDILSEINQEMAQSKRKAKEPVVDIDCEDVNNAVRMDSILFVENHFPRPIQQSHQSSKSIGKTIGRNTRKDCPSSSRYCLENLPGPRIMELEEANTSQPTYSCRKKKRNSPEPQFKGRRLVKKHTNIKDWLVTSNVEEECNEVKMASLNKSSRAVCDSSDVERRHSTSNRLASDIRQTLVIHDNSDDDDIEENVHVNDETQKSQANGVPTSDDFHEAFNLDSTEVDPAASSELSCVICWTDFSSTRGVLPCGHRFCFSCIQNWADHMSLRRKSSTCPLCKASFVCITKVDDAVSSDQKIYSQSFPSDSSKMDLYILPDETAGHRTTVSSTPVCLRCSSREPEDLLIKCNFCEVRCVHSFCLDPPLLPWTCAHCRDLQRLYLHIR